MKKINILIVGELYLPLIPWFLEDKKPQGAPAVYSLYQYLGTSSQHQFTSLIFSKTKNHTKVFPNGSKIVFRKFYFPNHYIWKSIVYFKLLAQVQAELNTGQYDIVYGLSNFASVAAIAGQKTNIPSVGRIYGTILTRAVKQRNYLKLYSRFFLDVLAIKRPADLVIATEDGTAYDEVFSFFNNSPKKPLLLLNGIDEDFKTILLEQPPIISLPNTGRIKIAYIARLESYKRQDIAIDVLSLLHQAMQDKFALTILGSGSEERTLKNKVAAANLSKEVQFIPEVPHEDLPSFLSEQHICLFLYEGGSLGNTLWECALAGKLIVTVDSGKTSKYFEDGVNCIMAKDGSDLASSLAHKILQLTDQDIGQLTKNSRSMVKDLIDPWPKRYDQEFDHIEATLL